MGFLDRVFGKKAGAPVQQERVQSRLFLPSQRE